MGNGARSWTTCGKEQQPVWCAESLASDLPKTPCNRHLWVKVRGGLSGLELECLDCVDHASWEAPRHFLVFFSLRRHTCLL